MARGHDRRGVDGQQAAAAGKLSRRLGATVVAAVCVAGTLAAVSPASAEVRRYVGVVVADGPGGVVVLQADGGPRVSIHALQNDGLSYQQQWEVIEGPQPYVLLRNRASGTCLTSLREEMTFSMAACGTAGGPQFWKKEYIGYHQDARGNSVPKYRLVPLRRWTIYPTFVDFNGPTGP